jgi:hypothetical protein
MQAYPGNRTAKALKTFQALQLFTFGFCLWILCIPQAQDEARARPRSDSTGKLLHSNRCHCIPLPLMAIYIPPALRTRSYRTVSG